MVLHAKGMGSERTHAGRSVDECMVQDVDGHRVRMARQRAKGALPHDRMLRREACGHDLLTQGFGELVERLKSKQRDNRIRVVYCSSENAVIYGERSSKKHAERPAPHWCIRLVQGAEQALVAAGQPRLQLSMQAGAVEAGVAFQSENQ